MKTFSIKKYSVQATSCQQSKLIGSWGTGEKIDRYEKLHLPNSIEKTLKIIRWALLKYLVFGGLVSNNNQFFWTSILFDLIFYITDLYRFCCRESLLNFRFFSEFVWGLFALFKPDTMKLIFIFCVFCAYLIHKFM